MYAPLFGEKRINRVRLLVEAHNRGKVRSLQGSAADEAAVDLRLRHQTLGVLRVHGAAVLDAHFVRSIATDEQANETIGVIRKAIAAKFGEEAAAKIRIQYGGSMKGSNVKGLMAQPEIDGGLIGGASLKAADFAQVVNF